MAFRRRSNLRPINSIKHVVDQQGGTVGGTQVNNVIAIATQNPDTSATANEVKIGSTINSIFLNVQVLMDSDTVLPNAYMMVYKNPGNLFTGGSIPDANQVGTSEMRKWVFHQEMAMTSEANDSIPITLFKGVLKIPRKMRRMGQADRLVVQLFSLTGNNLFTCIQTIYKEYS